MLLTSLKSESAWLILVLLLLSLNAAAQTPSFLLTPAYPGGLTSAIADFNGDGKLDIATQDSDLSAGVTILLGNGDGTFRQGAKVNNPIPNPIYSILTADFNGDGKPDLLISGITSGLTTVGVFLGNGDGTFQAPIIINPGTGLGLVTIGDVNGDGKPDFMAAGSAGLFVFLGKGDGTFTALQPNPAIFAIPALRDFNGDGKLDIAGAGGNIGATAVYVWLGNGDGTFQNNPLITPTGLVGDTQGLGAVGDFNGDGKLDVVVQVDGFPPTASVMLGNGDGTFQAPGPPVTTPGGGSSSVPNLAVADLNGDGKLDLVSANTQNTQVFLGNGDGTLTPGHRYVAGTGLPVAIADFNGDGKPDVAVGGRSISSSSLSLSTWILIGNGDGTFQGQPVLDIDGLWAPIVADFNGDGKPDLAVFTSITTPPASGVSILLNTGVIPPSVTRVYPIPAGMTGSSMAAADLNGDGKIDLVMGNLTSGSSWITSMVGNGDGTFGPVIVGPPLAGYGNALVVAGDFNNDHKPDVAAVISWGRRSGSSVFLLLGNGDGTFGSPVSFFAGQQTVAIMAADFNRDGNLDVAVATDAGIAILFGNGDGTFKSPTYMGGSVVTLITADVNGDGIPDLISMSGTGSIQVFLGNGNGTFQTPTPFFLTFNTSDITVGDINGDGKLDLITSGGTLGQIAVLAVFPGNGDGTFGKEIDFLSPLQGPIVAADLNGDGLVDVLDGTAIFLNTTPPPPSVSFSPVTATFAAQAVGTSSSPATLTVKNNGKGILTVSGVSVTGPNANEFMQTNNCSTVQPGTSCAIQITFTPLSAGNATASLSVADNAPGSPQTVALSGTGTSLALTATSNTATVAAGATANYALSIGGGWSGSATLTCTGAPKGAMCSVSPASVNVSATSASPLTVAVTTTTRTMAAALIRSNMKPSPWLWAVALIGLAVLPSTRTASMKKRARHFVQGLSLLLLLFLAACGGGGGSSNNPQPNPNGTPMGTYTLTVTATSGSVQQSMPLTLMVQ